MLRGMAARDLLPQGLKLARTARWQDMTQCRLERLGDLPQGLIGGIERGHRRPRVSQLQAIARALDVKPFTALCARICGEAFARVAAPMPGAGKIDGHDARPGYEDGPSAPSPTPTTGVGRARDHAMPNGPASRSAPGPREPRATKKHTPRIAPRRPAKPTTKTTPNKKSAPRPPTTTPTPERGASAQAVSA